MPPSRTFTPAGRPWRATCVVASALAFSWLGANTGQAVQAPETWDARPLAEADASDLAAGKRVYAAQCALCHGMDGSGGYGPSLLVPVLARASDDRGLLKVVDQGIPNLMPGYGRANGPRRTWQLAAYVRSLNAGSAATVVTGDAARGKAIYQERGCASCHVLEGVGRAYGPDLSNIGAQRGPGYIKQALLEPSARVPDGHVVVTAKPKDARSVRGVRVSEDVFWVYVRDQGGKIYRYWKSDLEALEREAGASLMPAYGAQRSATEVDDLVAYLASLRGQR
jgi:putative heme-binding domain-containing protein